MDIIAMIALVPSRVDGQHRILESKRKHRIRKNNLSRPAPPEKILDKTYGFVTYQDDILLIAIESWLAITGTRWTNSAKLSAKNSRRNGQRWKKYS